MPDCRNQAAVPSLSFCPFWHMTTTDWPVSRGAHSCRSRMGAPNGAGDQPRVSGEILVDADVDQGRRLGGADETGEFVG